MAIYTPAEQAVKKYIYISIELAYNQNWMVICSGQVWCLLSRRSLGGLESGIHSLYILFFKTFGRFSHLFCNTAQLSKARVILLALCVCMELKSFCSVSFQPGLYLFYLAHPFSNA